MTRKLARLLIIPLLAAMALPSCDEDHDHRDHRRGAIQVPDSPALANSVDASSPLLTATQNELASR